MWTRDPKLYGLQIVSSFVPHSEIKYSFRRTLYICPYFHVHCTVHLKRTMVHTINVHSIHFILLTGTRRCCGNNMYRNVQYVIVRYNNVRIICGVLTYYKVLYCTYINPKLKDFYKIYVRFISTNVHIPVIFK
jgi:hypothetical protein